MRKKQSRKSGQRIFRPLILEGRHKGKPKCIVDGCHHPGQHTGNYRKDGSPCYRAKCHLHHWLEFNMEGAYRLFKKKGCENVDGRLGYICTTSIVDPCQLDVDHVNNNHQDNREINLDTLCSCCHNYKTKYFSKYKALSSIRRVYSKNIKNTQKVLRKHKKTV